MSKQGRTATGPKEEILRGGTGTRVSPSHRGRFSEGGMKGSKLIEFSSVYRKGSRPLASYIGLVHYVRSILWGCRVIRILHVRLEFEHYPSISLKLFSFFRLSFIPALFFYLSTLSAANVSFRETRLWKLQEKILVFCLISFRWTTNECVKGWSISWCSKALPGSRNSYICLPPRCSSLLLHLNAVKSMESTNAWRCSQLGKHTGWQFFTMAQTHFLSEIHSAKTKACNNNTVQYAPLRLDLVKNVELEWKLLDDAVISVIVSLRNVLIRHSCGHYPKFVNSVSA